jgi:hypothetical protein
MQPPASIAQIAFELPDHTGHGVGHERVAVVGVVAVDGSDQPSSGGLAQVLRSGSAAGVVAVGQTVSQAKVGQDDPLAEDGIAAGGVVAQPAIDLASSDPVARPDSSDRTDGGLYGRG